MEAKSYNGFPGNERYPPYTEEKKKKMKKLSTSSMNLGKICTICLVIMALIGAGLLIGLVIVPGAIKLKEKLDAPDANICK